MGMLICTVALTSCNSSNEPVTTGSTEEAPRQEAESATSGSTEDNATPAKPLVPQSQITPTIKTQIAALTKLANEAQSFLNDERARPGVDQMIQAEWVGGEIRDWRERHDKVRAVIEQLVDLVKASTADDRTKHRQWEATADLQQGQELIWQAVSEAACATGEGRQFLKDGKADIVHAAKVMR